MKLNSYEDWRHCITVLCGIPLTADYIEKRLSELNDPRDYNTQKYKTTWGDAQHAQVIQWFERAQSEL